MNITPCGRVVALGALLVAQPLAAAILQALTGDEPAAKDPVAGGAAGWAENLAPQRIGHPVRGGKFAFQHALSAKSARSEIGTKPVAVGSAHWYGWSLQLSENFEPGGRTTVVARLAPAEGGTGRKLPCGDGGTFLGIDERGRLMFHLHHAGPDPGQSACEEFVVIDDVMKIKGRWIDFVLHAKWTGEPSGFAELWVKQHDNNFFQRVAYTGRTWWRDERQGPSFIMGARLVAPAGSPREVTIYTDEFRLGDAAAGFSDVAPGAETLATEAGRGQVGYVLYPSALNQAKIPIMVYTPPGYDAEPTRRYPVLYNLHGAGGGSPARQWLRTQKTFTQAMDTAAVPPMIIVYVNGLGDTGYIDRPGTAGPKVFSSIVTELIPFIDARYRTIADRRGRSIDGFSMGGGGAMMIALKRPDLFSSVVSYGGGFLRPPPGELPPGPRGAEMKELLDQFAHWTLVQRNLEAVRDGVQIRLVCGDQDPAYKVNVEFKDYLATLKIPVSWVPVPGVAHDTTGLYNRVGLESFRFIHEGFARP